MKDKSLRRDFEEFKYSIENQIEFFKRDIEDGYWNEVDTLSHSSTPRQCRSYSRDDGNYCTLVKRVGLRILLEGLLEHLGLEVVSTPTTVRKWTFQKRDKDKGGI